MRVDKRERAVSRWLWEQLAAIREEFLRPEKIRSLLISDGAEASLDECRRIDAAARIVETCLRYGQERRAIIYLVAIKRKLAGSWAENS